MKKHAFLVCDSVMEQISIEEIVNKNRSASKLNYEVQYFTRKEDAMKWLLK